MGDINIDFSLARLKMVEEQLKARGITNPKLLKIMQKTQRHLFLSQDMQRYSYLDRPLPIGYAQTISQPYIVAFMTESAAPFDAIIVTAAPKEIPQALIEQLKEGGRLIIPVGEFKQELMRITRTKYGIKKENLLPVRFVPMTKNNTLYSL